MPVTSLSDQRQHKKKKKGCHEGAPKEGSSIATTERVGRGFLQKYHYEGSGRKGHLLGACSEGCNVVKEESREGKKERNQYEVLSGMQ